MGLETNVRTIADLNPLFPSETDPIVQGDNHIRNIKTALKDTFPNITGPVTPTQEQLNKLAAVTVSAAEINSLSGVSGNLTELIDDRFTTQGDLMLALMPIGATLMWPGASVPNVNYMFAHGQALSRTTYAPLFDILGTRFGAGDGATTFNLPDTRGRSPLGVGAATGLTSRSLGDTGGAETHRLTVAEMPSHGHNFSGNTSTNGRHDHAVNTHSGAGGGGQYQPEPFEESGVRSTGRTTADGDHHHSFSGTTVSVGGGEAHNNMHPFFGINFIIRVQ